MSINNKMMKLIGMLDSPFVRRTAISLEYLGIPFEHEAVSVLKTFKQFQAINPVVKAPTLICDDGEILMESSLILQFIESTKAGGRSLWPREPHVLQQDMRAVGLALIACEKCVQVIYERKLRPVEFQYEPWMDRVSGQLIAAYAELEKEIQKRPQAFAQGFNQACITSAVAWCFTQSMLADVVLAEQHPGLVELSARMEATDEFLKYPPVGPGVVAA